MNKKTIISSAIVLLILIGIAGVLIFKSGSSSDLVSYKNSEMGISFDYPRTWTLVEHKRTQAEYDAGNHTIPVNGIVSITVEGDGYTFVVDKNGMGLDDKTYTHPSYVVDGQVAKTFENDEDAGFVLFLSVAKENGTFRFVISNPSTKSKEITDKMLASVKFF